MHTSFLFLLFFFKYSSFFKKCCRVIFFLFSTGPALTRAAAPAAWDPATAGRHVETGPRRVDQVEHSAKHQRGAVGESIAGLVTWLRSAAWRLPLRLHCSTSEGERPATRPGQGFSEEHRHFGKALKSRTWDCVCLDPSSVAAGPRAGNSER